MSWCFVPGCRTGKTGYKGSQDKNLFQAPSDPEELAKWRMAVPRVVNRVLTTSDFVCEVHFSPQEIQRSCDVTEEPGSSGFHCTLVKGAVPHLFPNLPSNFSKSVVRKKAGTLRRETDSSSMKFNHDMRKLRHGVNHLKFSNPGRFMEDFDPEQSKREMRKVQRRFYRESHRANRVYDSEGVRLADRADVCDCLTTDCPGCHFPCPRCSSPKCGAECRINRCWFYTEVEMEGSRTKIVSDFLLKADSKLPTDVKSVVELH